MVTTYGFLSNFTKFFAHAFRNVRPIRWTTDRLVRLLFRLDQGALKRLVPETLYFQAVIYVKK